MSEITADEEFAAAWERAKASIGTECQHHADEIFKNLRTKVIKEKELRGNDSDNLAISDDVQHETMEIVDEDNDHEEEPKKEEEEEEEQELPPIAAPTNGFFLQPILIENEQGDLQPMDMDCDSDNDEGSFNFSDYSDDEMVVIVKSPTNVGIDIQLLASILEKGKTATSSINEESDVILVIGGTGVGKSAFIQAIAGKKLIRSFDSSLRKSSYIVEGTEVEGFEIGHGLQSKTRHMRSYLRQDTSTFYVDSSGFGDTQSVETDIATSICVREIAQRAGRLRFIVLINAFQFYSNRATELRKHLDVVAKFIGHNFFDHKQSFTFLFTHCNEAFSDVRSLIDKHSDAETILNAMRSNIKELLLETKKATNDQSTQELVKFLSKSLKK